MTFVKNAQSHSPLPPIPGTLKKHVSQSHKRARTSHTTSHMKEARSRESDVWPPACRSIPGKARGTTGGHQAVRGPPPERGGRPDRVQAPPQSATSRIACPLPKCIHIDLYKSLDILHGVNLKGFLRSCNQRSRVVLNTIQPSHHLTRPLIKVSMLQIRHLRAKPHQKIDQSNPCIVCQTNNKRLTQPSTDSVSKTQSRFLT